jgi:nucleotide-binding universal stress UspA family protein
MLPIERILLPVDFSRQNAVAARHAASLARHFRAQLTLLHVNPVYMAGACLAGEMTPPVDPAWVTALEAQRYRELTEWHKEELQGLDCQRAVMTGDPATSIVEYANEHQIGLIVMATHGYGGFRKFLLGSVAAKVLNDARCPVWTGAHLAEGPAHDLGNLSDVLVALDNGATSERVLRWGREFAAEFRAPISVIHAIPRLDAIEGFDDPELRAARAHAAETVIQCLLRKTGTGKEQPIEVTIEEGDPAKVVAHASLGADVLVIGRGPCARERLRTHSYAIIREAPCPVISV